MTDACARGHLKVPRNTYTYIDTYGKTRRKCKPCTLMRLQTIREARVARKAPPPPERNEMLKCTRVNQLVDLHEKLEREPRAWLRVAIQAELDKLQCG
tara:strand:+ start:9012 stop:9305 length:294 start_codon:yes stop_codon:yes gene_type:complete